MNSKSNDSADVLASTKGSDDTESIVSTGGESRSERIRRLNRERQRRRREKIKMSRHVEATSTSSNGSGSDNLHFQAHGSNVESTVKVELEVPVEQCQEDPKLARQKRQTRRRQQKKDDTVFEPNLPVAASSTNNAILPACHDNNSKFNALNDASDPTVPVVANEVEVVEEKPQENGAETFTDALAVPTTSTEKPKRRTRESNRKRTEKLTVVDLGDLDVKRDYSRERERKKRGMTHDEVTARREKQRELKRKQKERMTSEQVEALRARYREWRRKRKETMTNDQLEIIRKGNRERQRRRRERLGIRKRQVTPQTKGVSEAVIQGLKNKQAHGGHRSEANLGDAASLVQAVNVVMNTSDNPSAAVIMSGQRTEPPSASVTSGSSVPGVQTITPTGISFTAAPTSTSAPTSTTNEVTTLPPLPVIGAQGSFLPSMAGSPMQGPLFHGMQMPGIPGAFLSSISTSPNTVVPVSTSQAGLQNTILPGMNAQGAFLSGITPGGQVPGLAGMHSFAGMTPQIGKDGQILHSISTLLPIAPVQGAGQGVAFLAPFSATGQIQGFPDPRYSIASSVRTPMAGSQAAPASVDSNAPKLATPAASANEDKQEVTPDARVAETAAAQKKSRTRGRKRTTSAAEMLVNLSNMPPTSTPMASMLSAMASAREGQTTTNPLAVSTLAADKSESEVVPSRRQTLPSDVSSNVQVTNIHMIGGSQAIASAGVGMSSLYPSSDLSGSVYSTMQSQNMPSKIPHMSTFLTTMGGGGIPGMPFVTTGFPGRPGNAFTAGGQFFGQHFPNRISVAVETDEIKRASVGTNTGSRENEAFPDIIAMASVGTMTDSLYKVSVGTDTGGIKQKSLSTQENAVVVSMEVMAAVDPSVAAEVSVKTDGVDAKETTSSTDGGDTGADMEAPYIPKREGIN